MKQVFILVGSVAILFLLLPSFDVYANELTEVTAQGNNEEDGTIPYIVANISSMVGAMILAAITLYFLIRRERKNKKD
ncbi:hypothetical protein DH09_03030 [Bacillaceae bacterium JMAK1]|nr:hypothetical protein DH09_03030 [Bacillaceae bacterium JMAK1]